MSKKKPVAIFIVDDNALFSLALKADIETVFEDMHPNIHLFETGEKCMEHFKQHKPEVVILDYNLNSKVPHAANGLEILDMIKKARPDTNVIMLSSEDSIPLAVKLLEHGAFDYIIKTETKFKKINYSLVNMFKTIDAKTYKLKYQQSMVGFIVCFVILTAMALSVLVYNFVSLS
ncbi:MAG: response regulator [Bacteroidia bacterium]